MGLPPITAAQYGAAQVVVTLGWPGTASQAAVFLGDPSGTPIASAPVIDRGASVPLDASKLDPNETYTVAVSQDGVTWGNPVVLVFDQPTFTAVRVAASGQVDVTWTLPSPTTVAAVVVAVYDLAAAQTIVAASVSTGNGARLVPAIPLDPTRTYAVFATGENGVAQGPTAQAPMPLVLISPAITATSYGAGATAGSYRVTASVQTATAWPVLGQLVADGRVIAQVAAAAGTLTFPLTAPLAPATWGVDALYQSDPITWGPPSVAAPVDVPGLPPLTALSYAPGTITATIAQAAIQPLTAALFAGTPSGTPIASGVFTGTTATIAVGVLNPAVVYVVALSTAPLSLNPQWGATTPLVFATPMLGAIAVDAAGAVNVIWTLAASATTSAVCAQLLDRTTGSTLVRTTTADSGARLMPPAPLAADGSYEVVATSVAGIASGPSAQSAALITIAPGIASVGYAAGQTAGTYVVTVVPVAAGTPPGTLVGTLWNEGVAVASASAQDGTVTFTTTTPLGAGNRWQVTLAYVNDAITGPPSAAAEVTVPPLPTLVGVRTNVASIAVATDVAAIATVTAALFAGSPGGAPLASATLVGTAATISTTGLQFDPATTYTVALSFDPGAPLPTWGTPLPVLIAPVTFGALDLDASGSVELTWTGGDADTATLLALIDTTSATTIATQSVVGTIAQFAPVAFEAAHAYAVTATPTRGFSSGPTTTSPVLIVTAPAIVSAVYAAGNTVGTYAVTVTPAVAEAPPGDVVGLLLSQGRVLAQQSAGGGLVTFELDAPLDPSAQWQVELFYQSGIVSGPPSVPARVEVPGLPAITAVQYAPGMAHVSLAAEPIAPVTAAVFRGAVGGTPIASAQVAGTSALIPVAAGLLDPGSAYVVALSFDPSAPTPSWGPSAPLVWESPTFTAVVVEGDGSTVDVAWTLPSSAARAVTLALYDATAGTTLVQAVASASTARLVAPIPLDPASSYLVSAVATDGVSTGPAAATPNLILTAPAIAGVAYAAGNTVGTYTLTVTPVAANSPPGSVVGLLLQEGRVVAQQAASGGVVTFTLDAPLDPSVLWQVALLYQSGIVVGPPSVPTRVEVPGLPAITALQYTPGLALVTLAAEPIAPVTAAVFQGAVGGTPIASAQVAGTSASIPLALSTLDPNYVYVVALSFDPSAPVPSWGSVTTLVWESPTFTALALQGDGRTVDVGWTLPGNAAQSVTLALYDATSATVVVRATSSGTSVRLAAATPLNVSSSYSVFATATSGVASGPTVTTPNLILVAPVIAGVAYAAGNTVGTYTVTVTPAAADTPPGSVVGLLLQDGRIVAQQAASGGVVTFTLDAPLDPSALWQVELFYQSGIVAGPPSAPWGVTVPGLPTIAALEYAPGTAVVRLATEPIAPVTAAVFQGGVGGTPLASAQVAGTAALIPLALASLDPSYQYVVALSFDPSAPSPVWGPPTTLVWETPVFTALTLDANGAVDATWTLAAGAAQSVTVALYDQTSGTTLVRESVAGASAHLAPATPLIATSTYAVYATATSGIASGPLAASPALIVIAPTIAGVAYTAGNVQGSYVLTVTPAAADAPPGTVVGVLLLEGTVVAEQTASNGVVTFTLDVPLDPGALWQVELFYRQGIVQGPPSVPVRVEVPGLPAIVSLQYLAGTVLVSVLPEPIAPVTAAVFAAVVGGTPVASAAVAGTLAAIPLAAGSLDPNVQYVVALSFDPSAAAPVWGPPTPLVWQTPTFTAIAIANDGTVEVAWSLDAGASQTVTVALYDATAGATLVRTSVAGTTARLQPALPLAPSSSYAVYATATSGVASGPTAGSPNLILTAPGLAAATYGPGQTAGTYEIVVTPTAANASPGTPLAVLCADELAVTSALAVGTTATIALPAALDQATRWQLALAYQSGIVTGPLGARASVPTQAPAFVEAAWDGTAFTFAWGPAGEPAASGGALIVRSGGTTVVSASVPSGFSAAMPATGIDPGGAYEVVVAPILGSVRGTYGAPLALIVAPPAISAVSALSGTQAQVSLTNVAPDCTSELQLIASDDVVATTTGGALGGLVALPQPVNGPLQIGARAVRGIVTGPPATVVSIVLAAPTLGSLQFTPSAITGIATAPSGLPFAAPTMQVGLYADGIAAGAPVVAASDGSFVVPVPAPSSGTLTLRASLYGTAAGARLAGAIGPAVPVLSTAPQIEAGALVANGTGWSLALAWSVPQPESAGAFVVTAQQGSSQLGSWTVTGFALTQSVDAVAPGTAVTVTVMPQGTYGSGPASAPATFIPVAPVVSAVASDGAFASAAWNAPTVGGATPSAYRLRLVQHLGTAWTTVAQAQTDGALTAAVSIPPAAGSVPPVLGLSVDVGVGGAWSAAQAVTTLIVAAPGALSANFDPLTSDCSVTWTAIAGATAYDVELTDGSGTIVTTVQAPALTATLAASAFATPSSYAIRVRASAIVGSTTTVGPWSGALPLVTQAPTGVTVAWNGATAQLAWEPVASPAVAAYQVQLIAGGAASGDAVVVAGTSASIALAEDTAAVYGFVVQAIGPAGAGMPAASVAAFDAGFYLASATQAAALLPYTTPAKTAQSIVLYLPQLFATPPAAADLPSTGTFVLAAIDQPPFAYTLTIGASSAAWTFTTDPFRAALAAEYVTFLTTIEGLTATPLAIRTVQEAISRAMPQTFAETLYYAYAFAPDGGTIDLMPGTVLRAEYENYQFLGSGVQNASYLDGYVGSAVAEYDVGSFVGGGAWLTGFDAFLSQIVAARGTTVPTPALSGDLRQQGGGGLIDTGYIEFQRPFCRLVYPRTFLAQNATGSPFPAFNAVLLAARTLTTMIAATDNVRRGLAPGNGVSSLYFRGRTTMTASIRVAVDGAIRTVSIGTTAGNVLDAGAMRPPVAALPLDGLSLRRALGTAIANASVASAGYPVGVTWPVQLGWSPAVTYGLYGTVLDVPLLHGDQLTTGGP